MKTTELFATGDGDSRRTLVVIFLRGGADGLNMVAPLEDDGYYRARPRIALSKSKAVALDGFYGLNPLMKDLEPMYRDGTLAIVHAAGSEDDTRSHFEAQDLMEHAGITGGGWLGRFLRFRNGGTTSPLSAVAVGKVVPECLRGAPAASIFQSLNDFSLADESAPFIESLGRLYDAESNSLGQAGRYTFEVVRRIQKLRGENYHPAHGAAYGADDFSHGLLQIARLIKARAGLEAASIDLGGWDSHFGQATIMDPLMARLAKGLAAFAMDLGPELATTTVVVMTEFGRRVEENSAFGTDHGRGSVMFVLGGTVNGGKIHGKWPGLTREVLEGPGDLPVANNYRNVLGPILTRHGAGEQLAQIFPGFELAALPL